MRDGQERYYVNDTGCGNTLDVSHPYVLRLVLDSLRWWVEAMGVDGFRFDLATTLGRDAHGFDSCGAFFAALRQDPVLARVKMIAEPWDLGPGGYRLGEFPPCFAEWNDGFRDGARRFWRGDAHGGQEIAERLLGSAGAFDRDGRPELVLGELRRLPRRLHPGRRHRLRRPKHNEANGEDNRDGHQENWSDNCGEEGESEDPEIRLRRARRRRNLLASVFLAQGTPMLRAGDEIADSQRGNNNAYCQDNADRLDRLDAVPTRALLGFTRRLIALRRAHPCLRQSRFLHGRAHAGDRAPDVEWLGLEGDPVDWGDPDLAGFCLLLRESAEAPARAAGGGRGHRGDCGDRMALVFNRSPRAVVTRLPAPDPGRVWLRALDTARPEAPGRPASTADRTYLPSRSSPSKRKRCGERRGPVRTHPRGARRGHGSPAALARSRGSGAGRRSRYPARPAGCHGGAGGE